MIRYLVAFVAGMVTLPLVFTLLAWLAVRPFRRKP